MSDSVAWKEFERMVSQFGCRRSRYLLFAIVSFVAAGATQAVAAQNGTKDDVTVLVDQASLLRLERPATEIVVGNPSIADVSVQTSKTLIVTGKSYGTTNLIVMDADGKLILNRKLIVQDPRTGLVTLYRGSARFTMDCAPICTTPLVIGDNKDHFEIISKEIKGKQSISQSSAEGSKQEE